MDRIAARGGVSLHRLGGGRSGGGRRQGAARSFSGASAGAFLASGLCGGGRYTLAEHSGQVGGPEAGPCLHGNQALPCPELHRPLSGGYVPFCPPHVWLLDVLAIFLSGLVGLAAVLRCRAEGRLTDKAAIVNGIFQFVFCADIISAIWVYRNTKEAFLK